METRTYALNKDEVLLVRGPAAVRAEGKGTSVLGIRMGTDDRVIVRKNKILPFETDESTSVQVILGEKGESRVTCGRAGVRIWKDLETLIELKSGRNKIMVIGETDSGKSTLASYLANVALSRALKTIIVDGDIGQGDLVPPGCVGASAVRSKVYDLRDLRADALGFVGFTSPFPWPVRDLVIKRMKAVISYFAEEYDLCIVNTDGYVTGEGMDYKVDMARELKPDTIICFGGTEELLRRTKDFKNPPAVVAAARPEGVAKSTSERSERRLSQYFRFLKDGKESSVDLKKIRLDFMGELYGRNLPDTELKERAPPVAEPSNLFAKGADSRAIVLRPNAGDVIEMSDRFTLFNQGSLRGMFVGLGSGDSVSGFAQVIRLRPDRVVTLNINFKGKFDTLFLSAIRLSFDLRDEITLSVIRRS